MKFYAVLCLLLVLMIGTKLAGIYTSPKEILGWDFVHYAVTPWYQIQRGLTPVVFGYGSVLLAAMGLRYQSMVAVSLIGLLMLLLFTVRPGSDRILSLLVFGIFLLGVPMSKAIEAGNPDVFLAVLFGMILLMLRAKTRDKKHSFVRSMVLGIVLGFFLNVKGFLLPFVIAALVLSGVDVTLYVWFVLSFAANALWPRLFGVPSGLFDVFTFAIAGNQSESQTIFAQIHYGNIAIVSYISNVLQAFGNIPTYLRPVLTYIGSALLAFFIYIQPLRQEKFIISKKLVKRSFSSFSFYLLVFTVCYIIMLTATAWSYDYRIVYVLPLLFCFLGEKRDFKTTRLLYLSIAFLLTKSLFIPKDRIMTVFLYLHFYFLLRTAVSLWKNRLGFV